MAKYIFLLVVVFCCVGFFNASAQHMIYLHNEEVIKANDVSVDAEYVFFIPYQSADSVKHKINRKAVIKIVYESGDELPITATSQQSKANRDKYYDKREGLRLLSHSNVQGIIFGLEGGYSQPSGKLAATNFFDNESGYATSGLNFNFSVSNYVSPNFGINGAIGYNQLPVNLTLLKTDFDQANQIISQGLSSSIRGHDFKLYRLAIGPIGSLRFGNLRLDLSANGGLLFNDYPDFVIDVLDQNNNLIIDAYDQADGLGFIFEGKAKAAYYLSKSFALQGGVDVVFGQSEVEFNYTRTVNGQLADYRVGQLTQPVQWVSVNLGVCLHVGQ